MIIKTVGVVGGSGFVGTHLANRLVRDGIRLKVLTRSREHHRSLWVLPNVDLIEADVHDPVQLERHLAGCDGVVFLAGILNEIGDTGAGFRRVHLELAQKLINTCKFLKIRRYLHMSALHAASNGPSHYLRSKGEAEEFVHQAASDTFKVTSFRPSVIFGPGDSFFNRFAGLLSATPLVFPLAASQARFQPVYVGDVVEAFARSLCDHASFGERYDLAGPSVYTLKEIVEYTAEVLGLSRRVLPLSARLSRWQAEVFEHLPGKPFSRDNLRSTSVDSILTGESGLARLGIEPTPVEAVVPAYLGGKNSRQRLNSFRSRTRES